MPPRERRNGAHESMGSPSRLTDPRPWRENPEITSMSVVLPAPLDPINPTISPPPTEKDTSFSATTPPKDMVT